MARWFHQSSTREQAYLGHIHVKIWVLSKSLDINLVIRELEVSSADLPNEWMHVA